MGFEGTIKSLDIFVFEQKSSPILDKCLATFF